MGGNEWYHVGGEKGIAVEVMGIPYAMRWQATERGSDERTKMGGDGGLWDGMGSDRSSEMEREGGTEVGSDGV